MKIVYQQRNKLKNTCILFPMTTDNSDNMLYYYYLINKRYSNVDYTCANSTNLELENIFNLVVKMSSNSTILDIIKLFIKTTTHKKVLIILNNLVFDNSKNDTQKLLLRLPKELPKKGIYFDLYNKDITHMKISNRNSILKYYQTYKYTSIFIDIGKLESKTRMKICNKLEDITNIDHLIKIKTKINELNCINEELPDLDNIYKTIKRKKVQINNKEIKNIIKVSSLPIDKYGIRLFINKSYVQLNEKFSKYILTHYSY
jgi:hypothetical protein